MTEYLVTVCFVFGSVQTFNVESIKFDGFILVLDCTDGKTVEICQDGTPSNGWNTMSSFLVTRL